MKSMKSYQITGSKRDVHAFCDEFGRNDGIDSSEAWFYVGDQTPTEVKYLDQLKRYPALRSRIVRRWTTLSPKDWASFPVLALYLDEDDRYLPRSQAQDFFCEDACSHCGISVYRQTADLKCPVLRKGKHSANLHGNNSDDTLAWLVSAEFRGFLEQEAPDDIAFRPVKDIRNGRYSDHCFQLEVKTQLPPIPAKWHKMEIEAQCQFCGLKRVSLSPENVDDFYEMLYVFEQDQCPVFQLAATHEYLGPYGWLTESKRSLIITQEFWQKSKTAKLNLGVVPARWYNPEIDCK